MTVAVESRIFALMVTFLQQTHRAAESALRHEDITPAQFFVLRMLGIRASVTQGTLADALGVTAGNVSQLIAKLERGNLVRRTGQGRAKHVSLTPRGERVVERLAPHHEEFLRGRFAALDAAERRMLHSLVEKLTASPPPGAVSRSRASAGARKEGQDRRKVRGTRSPD